MPIVKKTLSRASAVASGPSGRLKKLRVDLECVVVGVPLGFVLLLFVGYCFQLGVRCISYFLFKHIFIGFIHLHQVTYINDPSPT